MVGNAQFNAGAPAYSFNFANSIELNGAGIVNSSSNVPTFDISGLQFANAATAGNAIINVHNTALTEFIGTSSAGTATINTLNGGETKFQGNSTAANATMTNAFNGIIKFENASTAANASITNAGGLNFGQSGGTDTSTAGNATITNAAGNGAELSGGVLKFFASSTGGNATITNLANGAATVFFDSSTGGNARLINGAGSTIDISQITTTGLTAGSIEGAGTFYLGDKILTVGSNNLSTTVTGILRDGTCGCFGAAGNNGSLVKVGTGPLILDGINTYTGATAVNFGTLMIGDSSTPTASITSPVLIGASGTVKGYGTVTGNILNTAGGTLFPGGISGSIGTLSMTGTYTQSATSKMVVEVSPSTISKLAVTGVANLGGSLQVVYDPGTYVPKTYKVVTATGGVNGAFSAISSTAPAGLTQSVSYLGNEADLVVNGYAVVGGSTTGLVFSSVSSVQTTDFYTSDSMVFDHLADIETDQDVDGVKTSFAGSGPVQVAFAGSQLAQFGAKLPGARGRFGAWARGIGNWTSASSQGSAPGYSSSAGGMLAGLDHGITDNIVIGAAAGYTRTSLTQSDGSSGIIDTPRGMIYASYSPIPNFNFNAIAGFAYERITTARPVTALGATAVEGHNGFEENLALQGAYSIPVDAYTIVPTLGMQYVHHAENKFSESGASGLSLSNGSTHIDSLQPIIGVTVIRPFRTKGGTRITVEGKLTYSRELLSTNRNEVLTTASGAATPAVSVTPARNTVTLGPTVTVQATDMLQVYADYKSTLGLGKSTGHTIFVGARYDF